MRAICGTVKNNSNHNIGYIQVEINLYDKIGNLLESTIDNINNLEPNSTWKFEAPVINDKVSTYKIKMLQVYNFSVKLYTITLIILNLQI